MRVTEKHQGRLTRGGCSVAGRCLSTRLGPRPCGHQRLLSHDVATFPRVDDTTYAMLEAAFNNRPIDEAKAVQLIGAANDLLASISIP